MPDWVHLQSEFAKPSVMVALLWTEYREIHGSNSYRYTQPSEPDKRWSRRPAAVMPTNHKDGDKAFVDYGAGLWWVDLAQQLNLSAWILIGLASQRLSWHMVAGLTFYGKFSETTLRYKIGGFL